MKLLDLYCCQGGASRGYADAGFEVYGIDIDPQPRYPFAFFQGDALVAMRRLLLGGAIPFKRRDGSVEWLTLPDFAAIHASPPCQAHTLAWKINKREHPKLIAPTRELLEAAGLPCIIENVEEARDELRDPIMLCGPMFGLHTYRHRLFELHGFEVTIPFHDPHKVRTAKMGRPAAPDEYMHIVGNFSGVDRARDIMRMPWANRDGLREAIPPIYANWIGRHLLSDLLVRTSHDSGRDDVRKPNVTP